MRRRCVSSTPCVPPLTVRPHSRASVVVNSAGRPATLCHPAQCAAHVLSSCVIALDAHTSPHTLHARGAPVCTTSCVRRDAHGLAEAGIRRLFRRRCRTTVTYAAGVG
jgi:hypothetical protein